MANGFIDKARITVRAGNGGNGAVAFHREKYIAAGGPDGGDGGSGGSIILKVDDNMSTLMDFRYKRKYVAGNGVDGQGGRKTGKDGESLTIKVTLNPGHSMNYHSHMNRDEVWVVISGTGRTVVDGAERPVHVGDVVQMQAGCRHTVLADSELQLIEVQLGKEISVHDKQKFPLEQETTR